jgi:hypothetical protein
MMGEQMECKDRKVECKVKETMQCKDTILECKETMQCKEQKECKQMLPTACKVHQ